MGLGLVGAWAWAGAWAAGRLGSWVSGYGDRRTPPLVSGGAKCVTAAMSCELVLVGRLTAWSWVCNLGYGWIAGNAAVRVRLQWGYAECLI